MNIIEEIAELRREYQECRKDLKVPETIYLGEADGFRLLEYAVQQCTFSYSPGGAEKAAEIQRIIMRRDVDAMRHHLSNTTVFWLKVEIFKQMVIV